MNQPNVFGQTPLHLSVRWPKAIRLLLDAGAAVDAFEINGFTPVFYAAVQACSESVQTLGEVGCVLCLKEGESLLEYLIKRLDFPFKSTPENQDVAVVDCVIKLVAERRQKLTALARAALDSKDLARLRLSAQTVLDSKASLAISLLQGKIDVPRSLVNLSPVQCCVYHIPCLRARQAQSLWNAGFHDIDELDSLGQSPLMKDRPSITTDMRDTTKIREEFTEWLLLKGADLHCQQGHAFQKPIKTSHDTLSLESCKTNRSSATTALHYLAALWGQDFYSNILVRWCGIDRGESTWNLKYTLQNVLRDPLPDGCNCACSVKGCRAFTMMVKPADEYRQRPSFRVRRAVRRITQSTVHLLDADHSDLAWLRHEVLRFNTFERLRLRHTCCMLYHGWCWGREEQIHRPFGDYIIAEFEDDERCEVMEEQAEQVERLEVLLIEFENKFEELGVPFMEFFDGYWEGRMREISRQKVPIHQAELERTGVILRRNSSWSSRSSCEDDDEGQRTALESLSCC